ncbi:Regulator of chromosome condensation/beta-lactamase-inhibitor protein II domain containing protein [Dorcoceras hygrometricum]|uniref:Regulator of chromosome condensation/beta-lactamase-inhibitor protein II domain containing protein n=1 Tax=Dorcoceras hygrometricum TaxID=472368 RepID=A0A2Z7A3V1_9LAMI|nr:Regulator of chromosome condensation/beta-lactamase-inhibitor protein II domain containing protein [Dorcoceras hygrometricum]
MAGRCFARRRAGCAICRELMWLSRARWLLVLRKTLRKFSAAGCARRLVDGAVPRTTGHKMLRVAWQLHAAGGALVCAATAQRVAGGRRPAMLRRCRDG